MLFIISADSEAAIDKPKGITSAQVVRDLQETFKRSKLFAPWLCAEKANREKVNNYQQRRRKDKRLNVKIGHGGTLDPLATGVLIIGVGKGTKQLERFLACTKCYETVLLFGTATDSYDVLGKVLGRASYSHITRDLVEKALGKFKGAIMQKPPMFSALRVQGKRLYEYAREGKEVPQEIVERPVEVENIEIVEWLDPGSHDFKPPSDNAGHEAQEVAEKLLHINEAVMQNKTIRPTSRESIKRKRATKDEWESITVRTSSTEAAKRMRVVEAEEDDHVAYTKLASNQHDIGSEYLMSGGLHPPLPPKNYDPSSEMAQMEEFSANIEKDLPPNPKKELSNEADTDVPLDYAEVIPSIQDQANNAENINTSPSMPPSEDGPPAVKIRMTVTSGFYVRSLCHDIGRALNSFGIMAALSRTRQGDFELGRNVMSHSQLDKGEDVWGPEVESMLDAWDKDKSKNET